VICGPRHIEIDTICISRYFVGVHGFRVQRFKVAFLLKPDEINEAMKATHIKTKTKVNITALKELIRESKISELKEFKGSKNL